MKQPKGPVHPTPEMPEMTGRDGAVNFIAKVNTVDASQDYDHFAHVLGCALIDAWSDLHVTLQDTGKEVRSRWRRRPQLARRRGTGRVLPNASALRQTSLASGMLYTKH
jgi:hypothetical protein